MSLILHYIYIVIYIVIMIYIVGHKGWIGQMYINLFKAQGIQYTPSDFRGEDEK